ncbi:MAG: ABC transporter permease [Candidatus Sumerlaeia bacterium]|nr:ABC transporter permease [Candidatus Sumerlaeia bacterium]
MGKIFYRILARRWRSGLIFQQCLEIGVKSFPIAMLTSVFVGLVMVVQTGYQLIKFGAKGYVPGIAFIANAREMVPAFCAMVVGARVAASITAEIGSMKVTEQLDAMDVLDVDPVRYLCVPRVIAMTIMLPAICTICLVTGFLAGMVVSDLALNIPPLSYYNTTLKFAKVSDVMGGLAKTVVFGTLIALTGCYYGFRTSGGAAGVGRATTNSVVLTLILILVFDYLLSSFILALFMPF